MMLPATPNYILGLFFFSPPISRALNMFCSSDGSSGHKVLPSEQNQVLSSSWLREKSDLKLQENKRYQGI